MKNKMFKTLAMLGVSSIMLAGCGDTTTTTSSNVSSDSDTIKIGASFDVTGSYAQYGLSANKGALLAIKEYNEAGGVLGMEISYILEDNKGSQVDAANAFKKLDSQGIVAFIGSDISGTTETIANLAKDSGIPMVSPSATKMEITSIADNIFRACYIDPAQGEILASFAVEELGAKTAAVMINSESDYSVGVAEAFIENFVSAGGEILVEVNYSSSDVDFKSILAPVSNATPDIVVIPDYYETIANIAPQARQLGIDATLLGGDGWDGVTNMTVNSPESVEGSYFINHYTVDDDTPIVQDFIANFEDEYGETPNAFAALGYDAARLIIEAMKEADTTDPAVVTQTLQNIDLECVTGNITFDENRNPQKSAAIIKIIGGENTFYQKINPYSN
ncbi:MAG: hypothetical protein ATN35_11320 [Epulopiscium sp. Nele67-Bin004]|nr:MAG: hypothetical protein ATN35_11320 [Epulopiscium sp. Nele67-Bin004]